MNPFKNFQDALETMYPSLTTFSDLKWDEVSREYIASHDERPTDIDDFIFNFPAYLQDKSADGDCPVYLFELAFLELLREQILNNELEEIDSEGLHLNPSLSFLNLEHDVIRMMDEAAKGNVQIIERPHILCIYRHPVQGLSHVEITTKYLEILQALESTTELKPGPVLNELIDLGLVLKR